MVSPSSLASDEDFPMVVAPILHVGFLSKRHVSPAVPFLVRALLSSRQRVMKSRRDDTSKAAAKAAEEFASRAMEKAEEAIRRAEAQEDEKDDGPAKCFAIFKAEGFGMLEAMSQVIQDSACAII